MTVPTQLTLLRIGLTLVIIGCLVLSGVLFHALALALFAVAALTDWLDGYLARRWGQRTPVGALLDPIADKVLILGVLGVLAVQGVVPAWLVLVMACREVLVTALRLQAARRQVVLAAAPEGKQKTVSQIVAVVVILTWLVVQDWVGGEALPDGLEQAAAWLILGSLWVAMLLTLGSGIAFLWRHRHIVRATLQWR